MLAKLADALTFLSSEPTGPGEGGFGTADMTQWLWGAGVRGFFDSSSCAQGGIDASEDFQSLDSRR